MRITINGHVFDQPRQLDILVELDQPVEILHGVTLDIHGGALVVKGPRNGLQVTVDRDTGLRLLAGEGGYGISVEGPGPGCPLVVLGAPSHANLANGDPSGNGLACDPLPDIIA